MKSQNNLKNLIAVTTATILISMLICGCIGDKIENNNLNYQDTNLTKFNKNIIIVFTNETFDGKWNGKVMTGRMGEQAMDWYADQQNWIKLDDPKSPHSAGIDGIYKKFVNGNYRYIFVEAKETFSRGDYETPLPTDASYGPQMSDQWIEHHVVKIKDPDMLSAFYDGNYEKLVVIYKKKDWHGSTITGEFAESLDSVGINDVVIVKKKYEDN